MYDAQNPAEDKNIQNALRESLPDNNIPFDQQITETGKIRYTMRNDYLFKTVLQENEAALRELLSVLLHINVSDIKSCHIENPIIPGAAPDEKTMILDILLTLNDNQMVDIEMQVAAQPFWKERSLSYLCRSFGKLNSGDDYSRTKAAVHIGILDFDLFPGEKQLYSENVLKDKKSNRVYSDRLTLNVLSLKCIQYATEEDHVSGLYDWAKFFSAKTWEELKMAVTSEAMQSAVVTMRKLTADERIRQQCQAREDYEKVQRSWETIVDELKNEKNAALNEKKNAEIRWQSEKRKLMELLMKESGYSANEIQKMLADVNR